MTPPLQPDEDYKEIAEIIYGVEEAEKLIKVKAYLPQVEAVFKVMEAREQAARIDERKHLLICLQSDRDINHLEEFLKAETQGITPSNRKEDV